MMNQRLATTSTILAILSERGVAYELNSQTPISEVLNEQDKKLTREALFSMFRNDQVELSASAKLKFQEDQALKTYISGLVNNWIRKAPEFNCGETYKAKNPGSRQGNGDEQIKAMKTLLSITTDPEAKEAIAQAISDRQEELKPKTVIDIDKLPESLRHLIK